ncbi:MAG: hypothetical protein EOO41_03115 [Methanobacteriota archaeon]|nr:MAG: hypothetical protein EOO41_03115 [Euryarchaeota archaeon]
MGSGRASGTARVRARHRTNACAQCAAATAFARARNVSLTALQGLYRIPGDATKVDAVCVYLLTCENLLAVDWADMRAKHTVHDLCSVMKALLRRCKEPLVPYAAYDAWLAAGQADSDAEVLAALRKAVQALPAANQCTCIRLMTHLHRVAAHASANKMTPSALAACWVPSLMRREEASVSEFVEVPILARAVALFITHADEWKLASPTAAPVAWPASVPVVAATAERDVLLVSLLHMCTAALEDAAVPPSIYGVRCKRNALCGVTRPRWHGTWTLHCFPRVRAPPHCAGADRRPHRQSRAAGDGGPQNPGATRDRQHVHYGHVLARCHRACVCKRAGRAHCAHQLGCTVLSECGGRAPLSSGLTLQWRATQAVHSPRQ